MGARVHGPVEQGEFLRRLGIEQRAAALKRGLNVLWFSTGKDDGLMNTTKATIEALKKHGFNAEFKESPGGHTWINWRNYLDEFGPRLFQ